MSGSDRDPLPMLRGTLPEGLAVPPEVLARMRAIIAGEMPAQEPAEGTQPGSGSNPGISGGSAEVIPLSGPGPRSHRWSRPLAMAAAAVAVGAVALVGTRGQFPSQQPDSAGASSPELAAGAAADVAATSAPTRFEQTGRDYLRSDLLEQVAATLSAPSARAGEALAQALDPGCLAELAGSAEIHPILVDRARFEGSPAIIVAFPGPGGSLQVWTVARSCSATEPQVIFYAASQPSPGG